jgi:hypothetical protein
MASYTRYNNNALQTDFKIILNSSDTSSYTGTKFNAFYNVDLKQILRNDVYFDKSYLMTFQVRTTTDSTLTGSKVYLFSALLNNGSASTSVFQSNLAYQAQGILGVMNDQLQTYTVGTVYTISATTATTNYITMNTTVGLVANQQVVIAGTAFGGLTAGTYYIQTIVNSTQILLQNSPTLTTLTGSMTLTAQSQQQSNYLYCNDSDNSPIYINSLRGLSNINVKISDNTYTAYSNTATNYIVVLHFTEVQGTNPFNLPPAVSSTMENKSISG